MKKNFMPPGFVEVPLPAAIKAHDARFEAELNKAGLTADPEKEARGFVHVDNLKAAVAGGMSPPKVSDDLVRMLGFHGEVMPLSWGFGEPHFDMKDGEIRITERRRRKGW